MDRSLFLQICLLMVLTAGMSGCGAQDEIRRYSVPKEKTASAAAPRSTAPVDMTKDRMLAAILSSGGQTWFFKLSGANEAVAKLADQFNQFVQTVQFEKGRPAWELPEGWKQQAGGGMRFATIQIDATPKPLELTVIPLPTPEIDETEAALDNINRWRGQIGLSPISSDVLTDALSQGGDDEVQGLKLKDGTTAIVVNLVGDLSAGGGGMRPPFAGGGAPARPTSPTGQAPPSAAVKLTYDVPAGWTEIAAGGMRKAAFEVQDGDKKIEITVISLPGAAGGLLSNINRWRGQVGMPDTTEAELRNEVREIKVGSNQGMAVDLVGPADRAEGPETIFAAITLHAKQMWFFKLKGDSDLAAREKERFEAFLQSAKFE